MKLFLLKSCSLAIFCNPCWRFVAVAAFTDTSRKTFSPTWSDRTYGYSFVERSRLEFGNVVSMVPKGWLPSASKAARPYHNKPRITDIVYMPSFFSVNESSSFDAILEDEHFTSLLCDEGFTIHSINPYKAKDSKTMFKDIVFELLTKQRSTGQVKQCSAVIGSAATGRNLALVGCELSCIHLLNYLSETALPMSTRRVDIGAVVLIDPPPLPSLLSSHGRLRILSRYITPLLPSSSQPDQDEKKKEPEKVMSKKQKQRLLRAQEKAVAEEGGIVPFEIAPKDEDPVSIYRSSLLSKGEEGKYLISLAEKQSRSLPFSTSTSNINVVEDRSLFTAFIDHPESNVLTEEDELAFQQLFPSYQISQVDDDYDEMPEIQYSTFTTGEEQAKQILEVDMLGRYPRDITGVATAMKNRILVIATPQLKPVPSHDDSQPINSKFLLQNDDVDSYFVRGGVEAAVDDDEADHWGHAAVEEVASLFRAGPVLYTHTDDNVEDEEIKLSVSNEISDTYDKGERSNTTEGAAKEQRQLATTIADWLNMLPAFGYL